MPYRNPRMDWKINALMEFDHVVAVMPDGRVVDRDERFQLLDVHAPEVVIDYDGPFDEAQISKQHDAGMVENLRTQGWEVLDGYSGQYSYSGPVMHTSEFIGGGLEDRIREEPGYWVALAVSIHPGDDDPEHESNGGNGESDLVGWIVARKIGSEDEIAARTWWVTEDIADWDRNPDIKRHPQTDLDAAMSSVQEFYKGPSEDAARSEAVKTLRRYANYRHVIDSGRDRQLLAWADEMSEEGYVADMSGPRKVRIRALLMPKEENK